ncbi:hypothetical protein TPAU25S_00894 [Tsukamurella paurometabola]
MNGLDWAVLIGYFAVMVAIESCRSAGWTTSATSSRPQQECPGGSPASPPHVGLQRGDVHGYAGIAYTYGVTSFVTWSFPIAFGIAIGSRLLAPRIDRLRSRLHVASRWSTSRTATT